MCNRLRRSTAFDRYLHRVDLRSDQNECLPLMSHRLCYSRLAFLHCSGHHLSRLDSKSDFSYFPWRFFLVAKYPLRHLLVGHHTELQCLSCLSWCSHSRLLGLFRRQSRSSSCWSRCNQHLGLFRRQSRSSSCWSRCNQHLGLFRKLSRSSSCWSRCIQRLVRSCRQHQSLVCWFWYIRRLARPCKRHLAVSWSWFSS
jgi:hypothetical protein